MPKLTAGVVGDSFTVTDLPSESSGLKPCRNEDGVTLVRGDVIRVDGGRLKAYFALSNEGSLPIYYSSDSRQTLREFRAISGQTHEIKPYELEWVLLPVSEDNQPFKLTIGYGLSGFRSQRSLTASFSKTNKFPDACS